MDVENKNAAHKDGKDEPADFEKAISSTEYGLFNYLLLIIALPSCFATVYETSTMSYVLPRAECDLKLTLIDKGVLNAITYAGMISSAIFWGYIADTMGRKKILVFGFLLDGLCVIMSSFSQNVHAVMIFKYFGGFLACGPFAVLMSYITEFHGVKHRSRVMMIIGMFFSIATLTLPIIAWGILPIPGDFTVMNLVFHSWQLFLAACALPSLLSGICLIFFPESPKFLMSRGKNGEALKVFQTIYRLNTGNSEKLYPINRLIQEVPEKQKSAEQIGFDGNTIKKSSRKRILSSLEKGWSQLSPMFHKPYLAHSLHVYLIQFCILLGLNTVRLWLPQLFTMIVDFEENQFNSTDKNLCNMISYSMEKSNSKVLSTESSVDCEVTIALEMYRNTMIVGISGLFGYFIAGALINTLGNKIILIFGLLISGSAGIIMFWATDSLTTLILSSIYVNIGSISSTSLLGVTVNLFPTSLRTMIVSLTMMFGRLGALIGNVLFPYLMSLGCLPPFLMVGLVMIMSSALCILLPVTHKTALK